MPFADTVLAYVKSVRRRSVAGYGWRGGRNDKREYTVKHFCRHMLHCALSLSGMYPVINFWSMCAIQKYCPDERQHGDDFDDKNGQWVAQNIGVNPLLFSGWCCLLRPHATAPEASSDLASVWAAVRACERATAAAADDPCDVPFSLGPKALIDKLGGQ